MDLQKQILNDLKEAMKSGAADRVAVLRLMSAAFSNKKIEKKGKGQPEELTNEDVLEVLAKEAKRRKESITAFTSGGRSDLADKEKAELIIIEKYLPAQLSEADTIAAVQAVIAKLSETSNLGVVMKAVMAELKGKADSKLVSETVKKQLGL